MVSAGWTELWVFGNEDTASMDARVNDPGWETASSVVASGPIQPLGAWSSDTVMVASDEAVPHQDGFRTRVAVPSGATDRRSSGPADRSTAGSKVWNPVFHPTFLAMWAGTMWSNMTRQSVKGVVNTTVTVRPPFDPVTEATSR